MDPAFLRQAARLVWGSDLSPLLEREAKSSPAEAADKPASAQRELVCPKCSAVWIPGLNVEARERAHGRAQPTSGRNKRARQRAARKRAAKSQQFENKLHEKIGPEFLPEAQRSPQKYLHYTCKDCSGCLVLNLRLPAQQERRNLARARGPAPKGKPAPQPKKAPGENRRNEKPEETKPKKGDRLSLTDFML